VKKEHRISRTLGIVISDQLEIDTSYLQYGVYLKKHLIILFTYCISWIINCVSF
jgi:hypothetical protein